MIEIDGSHHFEEKRKNYDNQRTRFLEKQGLKVLRYNNFEVLQSIESVLESIMQAIEERISQQ